MTITEKRFGQYYEDDVSVTLRSKGGSCGGGRKCWSFVQGADLYNQTLTGDVSMTIQAARIDCEHIPCVVLRLMNECDRHDCRSSDS